MRQLTHEKEREVTFAKSQLAKSKRELDKHNDDILELRYKLKVLDLIKERERQVNALSIYSAYAETEGSISTRRTERASLRQKPKRYRSPPPKPTEYEPPVVTVKLRPEEEQHYQTKLRSEEEQHYPQLQPEEEQHYQTKLRSEDNQQVDAGTIHKPAMSIKKGRTPTRTPVHFEESEKPDSPIPNTFDNDQKKLDVRSEAGASAYSYDFE